MSFLMSVLKMIIMFLNCNGLPQKRLYFKRRVSHNIKQNLSILHCGYFFVSLISAVKGLQLTRVRKLHDGGAYLMSLYLQPGLTSMLRSARLLKLIAQSFNVETHKTTSRGFGFVLTSAWIDFTQQPV